MSTAADQTLDAVLVQVGEFGNYQLFSFVLVCLAVTLHSSVSLAYAFATLSLSYRCAIPECDSENSTAYSPDWLSNAVPFSGGTPPANCEKYLQINNTNSTHCPAEAFNSTVVESCSSYIYQTSEISIVQDFDLHCDNNQWLLSLVGTMNSVGMMVGIPIAGIFSDKFGRRNVLILGLIGSGVCGIARAFTNKYFLFILFEFLDAAVGSGAYATGFILAVELVGPTNRVLTGTFLSCTYAIGEILLAAEAWALQSWRPLLLCLYAPLFLAISYFWLTPESVRWLLSQEKYEEAKVILRKAAKINGRTISEETLEKLCLVKEDTKVSKKLILQVFKSKILTLRFLNCCFCWITCAFSFYGLILTSVTLAGNSYLDFILSALVEVPGYVAVALLVDRIGRKASLCGSFLIAGVACIAVIFIPTDAYAAQLPVFLIGKFGATTAFTICYIITSEMFPTPLRTFLLSSCSMVGRIGNMLAPQSPVLAHIWSPLPQTLFASFMLTAAFLSIFFPETYNVKLPDTVEEAEQIGRKIDKNTLKQL